MRLLSYIEALRGRGKKLDLPSPGRMTVKRRGRPSKPQDSISIGTRVSRPSLSLGTKRSFKFATTKRESAAHTSFITRFLSSSMSTPTRTSTSKVSRTWPMRLRANPPDDSMLYAVVGENPRENPRSLVHDGFGRDRGSHGKGDCDGCIFLLRFAKAVFAGMVRLGV